MTEGRQGAGDIAGAFADMFRVEGAKGGPLTGFTFGAKDLFAVKDRVTGGGNPDWARTHAPEDQNAWAVETLLNAGAALVGKTHTDELAYSLMGVNAHYGTPLNSADPRRVPGGSSSGSAAAVAAGLVDIGLGSDTGGSVRLPASFCGLWGIRTTFGSLPLDGALPFTMSFDTVGWMTRDGALMQEAAHAFGLGKGPAIRRLLLPVDVWACADPEVAEALGASLGAVKRALGPARPLKLASTGLETWKEAFRVCQAAEVWACLGPWVTETAPSFGDGIRERFEIASRIDPETRSIREQERVSIRSHIRGLLPRDTALVMPTSPSPAPFLTATASDLDRFRQRAFEMLCPAGLGGLPQLSVPAATVDGAPVGLSLVGAPGQDLALIELANSCGL